MTRDLKYLALGIGFLAPMLVFSMITAGAIIIALPALAQRDGGGSTSSSIRGGGSAGGGSTSTAITNAQMHLAQAMTALQNKNTAGAMLQLKLLINPYQHYRQEQEVWRHQAASPVLVHQQSTLVLVHQQSTLVLVHQAALVQVALVPVFLAVVGPVQVALVLVHLVMACII